MEIGAEIIAHRFLRRIVVPILDPTIGIVDPPHGIRQVFAEMTKDDVEPRMFIEQDPQMPSRQDLRNVSVESTVFLIQINASKIIGPQTSSGTS